MENILNFLQSNNQIQDFITLFLGLIVEAFPFVVLGTLVSVIVGIVNTEKLVMRLLPKNRLLSHVAVSFLGILMPVCECGNVPVVRRFMLSGFNVSHAVTFLLAAPILNPITLWSTLEAFNTEPMVAVVRALGAFVIAVGFGLIVSVVKSPEDLLTTDFYAQVCEHDHHHHRGNKVDEAVSIFQQEFITVMRTLVIGAAIAASFQTFVPREIIMAIGQNIFLSIIAMLILAFVISICANVDAFFALSFSGQFTLGSILAFLVFGPMIDIKMLSMLRTTFKTHFLIKLTAVVTLSSMAIGLLVNILL